VSQFKESSDDDDDSSWTSLPLEFPTVKLHRNVGKLVTTLCAFPEQNKLHSTVCLFRPLRPVFLNRRAAARYRTLTSIIPGRERFSWNLSF